MNSRDEPEKTFKVSLPDNNHATVYVRDAMSVEEFLANACARKNLNQMEHFVRVKKRRDMEDHNYFVPHRNDLIETYVSIFLLLYLFCRCVWWWWSVFAHTITWHPHEPSTRLVFFLVTRSASDELLFSVYIHFLSFCVLSSLSIYIYSFLLFQLHCLYPFWLRSILCFIFILLCLFGESCGSLTFIDVNVSNCSLLIQLFVWSCLRFVPHVWIHTHTHRHIYRRSRTTVTNECDWLNWNQLEGRCYICRH